MMRASVRDRTIIITAGIMLLASCYWAEARLNNGQIGAPLDDTYIHMRFAENLLAGDETIVYKCMWGRVLPGGD